MMQMQDIMLDQLANLIKLHVFQEHTNLQQDKPLVMMQMQDIMLTLILPQIKYPVH